MPWFKLGKNHMYDFQTKIVKSKGWFSAIVDIFGPTKQSGSRLLSTVPYKLYIMALALPSSRFVLIGWVLI